MLNQPEEVWNNEGHKSHLWYRGAVALKHNTLSSRNGVSSTNNGTKAESSCTIKSNVVDTEQYILTFRLQWESLLRKKIR